VSTLCLLCRSAALGCCRCDGECLFVGMRWRHPHDGMQRARPGSLEWRLVRQARYQEGARKRLAAAAKQSEEGGKVAGREAASVKKTEDCADAATPSEALPATEASPSVTKIVASLKPGAVNAMPLANEKRRRTSP